MQPLDKALRNQLESTVKQARELAESAARASLEQLGVSEPNPFTHLNEQERELRRRLRAHGRQLGDSLNSSNQTQTMQRLIEEVAYEHWHRMLFARFLAENNLLMYPDPQDPVAVSLEECEDLAADEGAANGWELASRYAAQMLPQIFRLDSPVFDLVLPPEYQQKLERLVSDLPLEVLTASDSLGWVYQFWQAKRKDEVNASGVDIGARELAAVTQLFTEPYMVNFLLDNALGAWWAARTLTEDDLTTAQNEYELRQKASIDGVPLEYLRFVEENDDTGNKRWAPAAGTFDAWPKQLADLKTLDPSCGSGHFLVAIFSMLVPMRMQLDGLSARDAVDAVLRENIHGLELDQRCVELAVFALALAAWKYPNAGGYRSLPEMSIACSGLSVNAAKNEWKQLGLGKQNLSIALDLMHDTFKDAPILGSLINPAKTDSAKLVKWDELSSTLVQALKNEQIEEYNGQQEAAIVAQGLAKAATLLSTQYQWVITNVPYLASGKQSNTLKSYCEAHYPEAKNELATIFLDRCLEFCVDGGTSSIVLPQNWLFLPAYKEFREKLLKHETWHFIVLLGARAFQTPMWDFNVQLISISRGKNSQNYGELFGEEEQLTVIRGVDASKPRTPDEKAAQLLSTEIKSIVQAKQLGNPDARVMLTEPSNTPLLQAKASFHNGLQTGDYPRFGAKFWENAQISNNWSFYQSTVPKTIMFGGREGILYWQNGDGDIANSSGSVVRGTEAWGKKGISISAMGSLFATSYTGTLYNENTVSLIPKDKNDIVALWAFCSSPSYSIEVRKITQALKVRGDLIKIPFDLEHWTKIAQKKYPQGLPKPYSNDPTQWIFHGHPCGSVIWNEEKKQTTQGSLRTDDTVLQVAVARLLGYRWPAELDEEMELADEQREWVKRCDSLLPFIDEDGIVCIAPVRGEASAADRLLNILATAYGDAWSNDVSADLLKRADHAGKTLETWLRDKFFIQHYKLFKHRPFIWQIWDGLPDGFSALVNYHKLDSKNLETLIYTYLGDWISRQKQDIVGGVKGAEERLVAATNLKKKLELILKGEAPYDIFVRWKTLKKQPIGWNPDINDGVRLNIRPFINVPDVKKKDAGVLRDKPNIKWDKDRGKDLESAPWYHLGLQYGGKEGDRINDHHLTLAEKQAARESSE